MYEAYQMPLTKAKNIQRLFAKTPTSTSKSEHLYEKLQELAAENALLEKEVANYRKDLATETRQFEDQMRSMLADQKRLKDLNHALEDKLSMSTKDKLDLSLALQSVKTELKDMTAGRDKMERDYRKEVHRLESAIGILREHQKQAVKEKTDLSNHVALLQKKFKESEENRGRLERELLRDPVTANTLSLASIKLKDVEIQRLKKQVTSKDALVETIKELEEKLEECETVNAVLEMKVNRLEASHEYACELEETLEKAKGAYEHNKKLKIENEELKRQLKQVSDGDINDLAQKLKALSSEE